jgi:hypothetical protein
MQFDNQKTRNVADVVAKILAGESAQQEPKMLEEELKGNQHKIDANKNKKIDAHDFKLLRAQKDKEKANSMKHGKEVKEEIEELDELSKDTLKSYAGKVIDKTRTMPQGAKKQKHLAGYGSAMDKMDKKMKEEVELDEAEKKLFPGTPEYKAKFGTDREKHEAKYGKSDVKKLAPYGYRDKSEYEKAKEMKEEKSFSAMLESYKEGGLKYIASLVKEEPDNEEFTKEVEEVKKKASEKKLPEDEARVAKGKVDAVKVEEEVEIEEGMQQILRKYVPGYAKHQLNKKMDAQNYAPGDSTKKTVDKDVNYARYKKVADKLKNEEVEELEETPKVDQGLSGKQKVAARASRADNSPILNVGNTTGGQWRGKTSPSPYKDSNVAKSGERKGMITKSAIQRTKDAIRSRLNSEETEIQVINADIANRVEMIDIEERSLTEPEMKKKEEIVKSMKKGMKGFKERYGERAKEVIYATAAKIAKEKS